MLDNNWINIYGQTYISEAHISMVEISGGMIKVIVGDDCLSVPVDKCKSQFLRNFAEEAEDLS